MGRAVFQRRHFHFLHKDRNHFKCSPKGYKKITKPRFLLFYGKHENTTIHEMAFSRDKTPPPEDKTEKSQLLAAKKE